MAAGNEGYKMSERKDMLAETMAKIDAMFAPRRELEARCMEGLIASGRFTFIDENQVHKFEGDEA